MQATLMILAAGIGSRYGSLKQLDKVGPSGETIIDYSIFDAKRAGFGKVVFIIRKELENDFRDVFYEKLKNEIDIDFAFQELSNVPEGIDYNNERQKPWGTGHAILVAASKINEPFAVINADDFYGAEAFKTMSEFLQNEKNMYSMVGYQIKNTLSDFGSVSRGVCNTDQKNTLIDVTERTKIQKIDNQIIFEDQNQKQIELHENTLVSMNFWGFQTSIFNHLDEQFREFIKQNRNELKAEFYIPFVVDRLGKNNVVKTKVLESSAKWFGVTYKEDKPIVIEKIKELVNQGKYPEKLWK